LILECDAKSLKKAMMVMNRQMNIPAMQKIMMEFEKQNEMMDMKQEMMSDTMDDVLEQDNEEEDSEEIINQVLDEIGINLSSQMVEAPTTSTATQSKQKEAEDLTDLQSRLDNLRKN
jgi:charged multivesicular body protein 2A